MAGIVPDAVVGYLLQNLVDFIKYNHELISGAKENFEKLCNELREMQSFVELCTQNYSSSFLDELASSVRRLVYKAEDAVERFIVEAATHKLRGRLERMLREGKYQAKIGDLAKEIEDIRKEVQKFHSTRAPLGFQAMGVLQQERLALPEERRRNLKPAVDDTVVGLQDEAKKVMDLLTKGNQEELDVISIVGMYGLGKTTLARKVYNDERIEFHFFIRAFVEVSLDFDPKEVLLKIIKSFAQVTEDIQKMQVDELAKFINEKLAKNTYLIVLDDVWTTDAWDQLKGAFPINNKGSRVLITTRQSHVAKDIKIKSEPHEMRRLHFHEAQELFRLKVFGDKSVCPPDLLLEISILKKCDGLPLAIVLIAGMLKSHQQDANRWRQVANGVRDYDPMVREKTEFVIKLSYDRLPHDLKLCFLYLGVFREDSEISARTLTRLWVSEGLIAPSSNPNLTLEDVAEFYLQNLVDRSMVMVQNRSYNDQVKTIKIHDTLREFCKAHAQKEKLFFEIKGGISGGTAPANTLPDEHRRLCINSGIADFIRSINSKENHVRSFLCFAQEHFTLPQDRISAIPKAFKLLRILDIRSLRMTCFPPDIYYLVLLKYIAIFCDDKSLPKRMSTLSNLQTLIVLTSANTILTIEADLWKMAQLRHLETNATAILSETKEESPKNENLQTLSTISPESCKKEVFERTPMLRKLGIRGNLALLLEDNRQLGISFSNISRLAKVENLKLLNETRQKIHVFPSWELFPSKLAKLTLSNTLLEWKYMSTLGKLENLEVLKLKDNAFGGPLWNTEDGGFRRLKVLHIGKTDLCLWNASASHFPVLTRLYIQSCSELSAIPPGFQDISTLQMINLYSTNRGLVSSAKIFQSNKKFKVVVYPPEPEL